VLYNTPRGKSRIEVQDFDPAKATNQQILTSNAYDPLDRLVQTTAPEGNSASFTYDIASNVLTATQTPKPGSPLAALVTTTTWDPIFNKPLSVTDPRGLVTQMAYDPATGNLVTAVADAGGIAARIRYGYDGSGLLTSSVDPMGTVTEFAYDDAGNRVATIRDAGPGGLRQTTTATWDARGDPVMVTDPRGNRISSTFDAARRLVATVAPGPGPSLPGVTTAYAYDPAGRVVATSQTIGGSVLRTTSSLYTPSGKLARTTDPNGNVTRFAYDVLDRQVGVTDALGRQTQYGYDALGRMISVSNPGIRLTPPLQQQAWTRNGQRASARA
jgi:YD repeat-containing protein